MTGIFCPVISYHHQYVMEKLDTALGLSPLFSEFVPAYSGIEQIWRLADNNIKTQSIVNPVLCKILFT